MLSRPKMAIYFFYLDVFIENSLGFDFLSHSQITLIFPLLKTNFSFSVWIGM
ncbi:Uncharacterized protein PRO82_001387 [Candidatus Protochlamydia amoebophila]|nr:Uncharacterized protein [Candidatus Protochlamydia amoebophila]